MVGMRSRVIFEQVGLPVRPLLCAGIALLPGTESGIIFFTVSSLLSFPTTPLSSSLR